MEMRPVRSSNLHSVGYDRTNNTLRVEFNSGSSWDYLNVPEEIHQELMEAPSAGRYFSQAIKPVFTGHVANLPVVEEGATERLFAVAGRLYRRGDPRALRGVVWCTKCGREERVRIANCLRRGWPKCCELEMTLDSPNERVIVFAEQTENEKAALALASSPGLLRNRLLVAKRALRGHVEIGQIDAKTAARFATRGFDNIDYGLRRLYSQDRGLALQWQTRRRPDQPESFHNLQVANGVVSLIALFGEDGPDIILPEV